MAAVVELVTRAVLAPAAVRILDRYQPFRPLGDLRRRMIDAAGIERAERRPGAINVIEPPAPVPTAVRQLRVAQKGEAAGNSLCVCFAKLRQHREATRGDVFGRWVEQGAMIGERNVVEVVIDVVDVESGPAAIAALQALDPLSAARDRRIV